MDLNLSVIGVPFENFPKTNTFIFASDGQSFTNGDWARAHATNLQRKGGNGDTLTITREEYNLLKEKENAPAPPAAKEETPEEKLAAAQLRLTNAKQALETAKDNQAALPADVSSTLKGQATKIVNKAQALMDEAQVAVDDLTEVK